ncbi:cytidine deaminase [Patescibacteria group bacterium]|nr:cytidine deaminase [Patescibacteria group bacterium]
MAEIEFWSPLQQKSLSLPAGEQQKYLRLLDTARTSTSVADQSGHHVRVALLTGAGQTFTGGNYEYALSDSFVHAESSALNNVLTQFGRVQLEALAYDVPPPITPTTFCIPCGRCLDILSAYASPDLAIVVGDSRRVSLTYLKDYLFADFANVPLDRVSPRGQDEAVLALKRGIDAYLPETHKDQVYGVALVGKDQIWRGSLYTNASYDAVTPILSAIQTWRNTLPLEPYDYSHFHLTKAVVASFQRPHIFYRDRQALTDLDELIRLKFPSLGPLPVDMLQVDSKTLRPLQAWRTNAAEWLPFPYTPSSFGMHDTLHQLLTQLT